MKARTLKSIGRRLYGNDWQSPLGRAVGVHRITVWRWATGASPIPDDKAAKIKAIFTRAQKPWPV
jgi:hypothetical protein